MRLQRLLIILHTVCLFENFGTLFATRDSWHCPCCYSCKRNTPDLRRLWRSVRSLSGELSPRSLTSRSNGLFQKKSTPPTEGESFSPPLPPRFPVPLDPSPPAQISKAKDPPSHPDFPDLLWALNSTFSPLKIRRIASRI